MLEKHEDCPTCGESGDDWLYDAQHCLICAAKPKPDVITGLHWWAVEYRPTAQVAYSAIKEIERLRKALEYYADQDGKGKDYIICDRATRGRVSDVHALGEKARSVLSQSGPNTPTPGSDVAD